MQAMSSYQKVNKKIELDLHFGRKSKIPSIPLVVTVSPSNRPSSYNVLVLLPVLEYGPNMEVQLCKQVMMELLDDGDEFFICHLHDDNMKMVTEITPIVSFDPQNLEEFCWLRPPTHLMH